MGPPQGKGAGIMAVGQLILQASQGAVEQAAIALQTAQGGAFFRQSPSLVAEPDGGERKHGEDS